MNSIVDTRYNPTGFEVRSGIYIQRIVAYQLYTMSFGIIVMMWERAKPEDHLQYTQHDTAVELAATRSNWPWTIAHTSKIQLADVMRYLVHAYESRSRSLIIQVVQKFWPSQENTFKALYTAGPLYNELTIAYCLCQTTLKEWKGGWLQCQVKTKHTPTADTLAAPRFVIGLSSSLRILLTHQRMYATSHSLIAFYLARTPFSFKFQKWT